MPEAKLGSADAAPVTLQNVAEKAGVSVMTVSRALSGEGYVAEKTRARVLAAASELGYSPNISARMMRGSRTNVIGVLVNDLQSTVINEIIGAVSVAVRAHNMDLIIYNSIEELGSSTRTGINQIMRGLCDGLLFILPRLKDGYIDMLEQSSLPMVLINYCRTETTLPVVRGDNRMGGREAVNHLLQLGHRRIAFIGGSAHTGQSQERQRGYAEALKAAGIAVDKQLIAAGDFGQLSGFQATGKLLALAEPPTAIFAANDEMAFGAMDAVRAHGLRVPQDVSVIGFDDIPAASHVHPKLSTLRQPLTAISEAAVQELLRRITGADAQQRAEFPSQLVVRESTGPAPVAGKAPRGKRAAAKH
ncbi:LacI family DNA-binding transcriptional regulator [Janthinobacterium sp. HH01]|uniref:LacI family DNA-binding transcriptional regulator n=1 Tax=Janthinobacterium sp. HH01 TaxID=1198452 RepID=UPI001267BE8F|nr:LacI family DNA-binding transcriptional regulator [Janthinobacterium sp. HH01]